MALRGYRLKDLTREDEMDKWTKIENLTMFLVRKTGSSLGCFIGRMPAKEQRELFGEFLGKGKIIIDGARETLVHSRKVCFGLDHEETFDKHWRDL